MKDVQIEDVQRLIHVLGFLTPRQRKHFLNTMNKEQMRVLEVACFNLANNHRGMGKKEECILRKHKNKIETLASKNFKHSEKRKVVQSGGFLPAVLPIIGTLLTSFLT